MTNMTLEDRLWDVLIASQTHIKSNDEIGPPADDIIPANKGPKTRKQSWRKKQ